MAMAAGLATLRMLDAAAYDQLETKSARLERGLVEAVRVARSPGTVQRVGSLLTLFFTPLPVRNFTDAAAADHSRFAAFFRAMLRQGIYLPPSGYEAWFVSLAHDDDVIDRTIDAAHTALAEIR